MKVSSTRPVGPTAADRPNSLKRMWFNHSCSSSMAKFGIDERVSALHTLRAHICAACRVQKSASLLTASIVFGVARGEPVFRYGNCFSGALIRGRHGRLSLLLSRDLPFRKAVHDVRNPVEQVRRICAIQLATQQPAARKDRFPRSHRLRRPPSM